MRTAFVVRGPRLTLTSLFILFMAGEAWSCLAAAFSPGQLTVADGNWGGSAAGTPGTRGEHCAILDAPGNRMVVFGGYIVNNPDGLNPTNQTWQLTLGPSPTWSQVPVQGTTPSPRSGMSGIFDPVRRRMIVFGGNDAGGYRNDVWQLSLSATPTWTQLAPAGPLPSARIGHGAVYDPVRDRMIVFGGGPTGNTYLNDVWSLSLSGSLNWVQLSPAGPSPVQRSGFGLIYDPVRDRLVMFGGIGASGYLNDVWQLSLAGSPAWTQLAPSGTPPQGRTECSTIFDPVRDRMVIFGGSRFDMGTFGGVFFTNFGDVPSLDLAGGTAWQLLTPSGSGPAGRYSHSAIYDRKSDRLVVYGGLNQGNGPTFNLIGYGDTDFLNWNSPPASGPDVDVVPMTLDYASVPAGMGENRNVIVSNFGTASLTVSNITANDPSVSANPTAFTLAPWESRNVTVQWAPAASGAFGTTVVVTSNDPDQPARTISISGTGVASGPLGPTIATTPDEFDVALDTNQSTTRTLRIDNLGGASLTYTTQEVAMPQAAAAAEVAASGHGEVGPRPAPYRAGGPDAFGYTYRDSDEPGGPTFNWIDVRSTGTQIVSSGNDVNAGFFPIGFSFPFYGNVFSMFRLCSNGWISFTNLTLTTAANATLPNNASSTPENLLAVFWDDLIFSGPHAWYESNGERLVIQYQDVERLGEPGKPNSFEVVLTREGTILFQYDTMSSTLTSATIGIMNATRDVALQVSAQEAYAHSGLAIRFAPPPLDFVAVSPPSGSIAPGDHSDLTLTFNSTDLPGNYTRTIRIEHNDPFVPARDIPCHLAVSLPVAVPELAVERFGLRLSGPNPSAGGAVLELAVPKPSQVVVRVFDVHGALVRELARREFATGIHPLAWDGARADGHPVRSGVYFVQAIGPDGALNQRVVLLR